MTLQQLADCFGADALPDNLKGLLDNQTNLSKKYKVCWLVEPNNDKLPGHIDKLNMPYRSVYWLENQRATNTCMLAALKKKQYR